MSDSEAVSNWEIFVCALFRQLIPNEKDSEPTRSILYRSAGWLAYQCEEYERAIEIVGKGLKGSPPPDVKQELEECQKKTGTSSGSIRSSNM